MKKRYLIAGAYGTAGVALALKLWNRPRDLTWKTTPRRCTTQRIRDSQTLTACECIIRKRESRCTRRRVDTRLLRVEFRVA
jgi:hypothetical protein